jgi:DNA polymerase III psi subunit
MPSQICQNEPRTSLILREHVLGVCDHYFSRFAVPRPGRVRHQLPQPDECTHWFHVDTDHALAAQDATVRDSPRQQQIQRGRNQRVGYGF